METVFLSLLNMSISAGWVAVAVLGLRLLMRRMPRWIYCLLWGLVGIRLVWPFSIESMLSLLPSAQTVPPEILYMQEPVIDTGVDVLNNTLNPVITGSFAPEPFASVNPLQIWTNLAGWLWMIGMAAMVLYTLISTIRLSRRLRGAVETDKGIWLCDSIDTPFILGVFRPRIYLPSSMDQADWDYVLAHERAHLKRRDHWWKPLGFALLAAHWFNPVMWLAYGLLCSDIELACDERVIGELGAGSKKAYSMALINCSVPRRMLAACPLAFGEVGVKQRVKAVLKYKKPAFWAIIVAVMICIVVAVCFLTDPRAEKKVQQYAVGGVVLEVPEGMLAEHSSHISQLSDRTIYHERLHMRVSDDPYEPVHPGIVNIQYAELDATPERYGLPAGTSMQEDFLQQEGVVDRVATHAMTPEDKGSMTNVRSTTRHVGKGVEALEVTCDAVIDGIDVSIRNLTFYEDGNEYTIVSRWRKDATQQQKEDIQTLIDSVRLLETELPDYRGLVAPMEASSEIMAIHCPPANEKGESSIRIGTVNSADLAKWLNTTQWKACNAPMSSLPSPGSVEFVLDSEYYEQRIAVHQHKGATPFTYAMVEWRGLIQYYQIGLQDYEAAVKLLQTPELPVATQWFDYSDGYWPDTTWQQNWADPEDILGTTLRCTAEKMSLITETEYLTLYEGMPVWNAYFADLNGDGTREVCSTVSMGSGIIDNRIMVYDLVAHKDYELEARGTYDYNLLLNNTQLLVTQSDAVTGEPLMTGQLALVDGQLSLVNGSAAESNESHEKTEPAVQETDTAETEPAATDADQWYTVGDLAVKMPSGVAVEHEQLRNEEMLARDRLHAQIEHPDSDWYSMNLLIQRIDVGATEEAHADILEEGQSFNDWYIFKDDVAEKLIETWSYQRLSDVKTVSTGFNQLGNELKAVDVTFTGKSLGEESGIDLTYRVMQFYHKGMEYSLVSYWRMDAPEEAQKAVEDIVNSMYLTEDNGSLHRLGDLKVRVPAGMLADYRIIDRENDLYQECLTLSVPMVGNELNKAYMDIRAYDNDSTEERYAEYLEPGQTVNDWYIHQENAHRDLIDQSTMYHIADWKTLDTGFYPLNNTTAAVDVTYEGYWKNGNREPVTVRTMKFFHGGWEYVITACWRDDATVEQKAALEKAVSSLRLA